MLPVARFLLEALIILVILGVVVWAYLAARRREQEQERMGLLPPEQELAQFDELLKEHERMKGPSRWQ